MSRSRESSLEEVCAVIGEAYCQALPIAEEWNNSLDSVYQSINNFRYDRQRDPSTPMKHLVSSLDIPERVPVMAFPNGSPTAGKLPRSRRKVESARSQPIQAAPLDHIDQLKVLIFCGGVQTGLGELLNLGISSSCNRSAALRYTLPPSGQCLKHDRRVKPAL